MTNWFTADLHFFHKNVIQYCNRPFNNIDQMNKKLIENYNLFVKEEDTCYFLGDLAMLGSSQIIKLTNIINKMNGKKILILGNHDEGNVWQYIKLGFESVHSSLELCNGWILVHDPSAAIKHKDAIHLVGHVHDLFLICGNCINVGIDVWNLTPVSEETLNMEVDKLMFK